MEGSRKRRDLLVRRKFEGNRLDEEVWVVAYEELWPAVRRALSCKESELSAGEEELAGRGDRIAAGV